MSARARLLRNESQGEYVEVFRSMSSFCPLFYFIVMHDDDDEEEKQMDECYRETCATFAETKAEENGAPTFNNGQATA